jgi:carbon starvation protein
VLLLAAVWGGKFVHSSPTLHHFFLIGTLPLAWSVILYGLAASILPVWLLLAPRDYLSTFMKLGTIGLLAVGVLIVLPELKMPPVSKFADGTGLVVPGTLFPFCFITIACGAISGFHTLIASGITPKIISRESHARVVGYGAMCLESLVAIMALIAACTLEPDVYLAMNTSGGNAPTAAEKAAAIQKKIDNSGFVAFRQEGESRVLAPIHLDKARMEALAQEVGEPTLYGKTGGAATLAVGMATIFGRITHGKWMDIWYHFAIMFEALFILTTVDAGTRVGRYLLQDFLGGIWRPLGNTKNLWANLLASFLVVAGWGFFLVIGAANPDGGVKALWPIFGIANQLLASIALCLGTTILLKGQLTRGETGRPVYALALLIPLLWLLTVTFSAGFEKLFSQNPSIGFISGIQKLDKDLIPLTDKLSTATTAGDAAAVETAKRAIAANRQVRFNHAVDIPVTMILLGLAATIVAISAFEWWRLLTGRRKPDLTETEPVWLEESSIPSNRAPALGALGSIALGAALIKELSSEAAIEREMQRQSAEASDVMIEESERRSASHTPACQAHRRNRLRSYLAVVDRRSGNPRCC